MSGGTFVYGLAGGGSFALGVVFLVMGFGRSRIRARNLPLSALAFASAGLALSTLQLQSSDSVDAYAGFLKGPFTVWSLVTIVAIVWAVAVSSNVGWPRIPLAFSAAALLMGTTNFFLPSGLLVDEIVSLRDVELFGETFVVHSSNRGSWRWVLDSYLVLTALYLLTVSTMRWRRNSRKLDPLTIGVAFAALAAQLDWLAGDLPVDWGHLTPFGVVALVIGLAIQSTVDLGEAEQALSIQSERSAAIVDARAESLEAANLSIVAQLQRQNDDAVRLTQLTRQFVALSTITFGEGDVEQALVDTAACVGEVVIAAAVTIRCPQISGSGQPEMEVGWKRPDPGVLPMHPDASDYERRLHTGDHIVGHLVVRLDGQASITPQQRLLVNLAAEYLGAFLHRIELEASLVTTALDAERERIARDLHDSLSQRLYAAAFNAEALATTEDLSAEVAAAGTTIRSLVLAALAEMRTLIFDVELDVFRTASLPGLVEQLCTSMGEVYQRRIGLSVTDRGPAVSTTNKVALYRLTQEALGNALRHANASNISVSVHIGGEEVMIEVFDDGVGFDPNAIQAGYGLRNIQDRATEIGALLDIRSSPGSGTRLSTSLPRGLGLPSSERSLHRHNDSTRAAS